MKIFENEIYENDILCVRLVLLVFFKIKLSLPKWTKVTQNCDCCKYEENIFNAKTKMFKKTFHFFHFLRQANRSVNC